MRLMHLAPFAFIALVSGCTTTTSDDEPGLGSGKADGALSEEDFWAPHTMYYVRIDRWDNNKMTPASLFNEVSVANSEVRLYEIEHDDGSHCPNVEADDLVFRTKEFSVRTSGNMTNGTPKSSYKVALKKKDQRLYKMKALNLKSMWNDVSQMRESLAWTLFRQAGIPAPRHTYARLCINNRYYGLYSLIETTDKALLEEQFGDENEDGNLYKANWKDIGPATLEYRKAANGDDSGKQYFSAGDFGDRTYELDTNNDDDDDPALKSYDDLAAFIRVINGVGLPGGEEKFATDAYRASVENIFNAKAFLRWASINTLIGAWDNYWRTPSNYYLYDSGKLGAGGDFMSAPYFTWIPHDYDNSFGIDFFGTPWAQKSITNWESAGAKLPLIRNLLRNKTFLRYYLDHLEYQLDCCLSADKIAARIGTQGGNGLWERVRHGANLESDGPQLAPHTGRQFTNDQVYWNGFQHHQLDKGNQVTLGIYHFLKMRETSAREQLRTLRAEHPRGSSNATFPVELERIPDPS